MRWGPLFADLELQLEAAGALARQGEVAELTRAERSTVLVADRLQAAVGRPVRLTLRTLQVDGTITDVGSTWALLAEGAREHLVPLTSVVLASGVPRAASSPGPALRRLGLGHALRAVARDRSLVRAVTGGPVLLGRVDGVGADHLDLALAFEDSGRPTGERSVLPFAALELLTRL
jgi:hypothetical protein